MPRRYLPFRETIARPTLSVKIQIHPSKKSLVNITTMVTAYMKPESEKGHLVTYNVNTGKGYQVRPKVVTKKTKTHSLVVHKKKKPTQENAASQATESYTGQNEDKRKQEAEQKPDFVRQKTFKPPANKSDERSTFAIKPVFKTKDYYLSGKKIG
ncbi:uncharacterized protein J4E87_006443 [Alternaria ethzedia]|uniref:uncharacterized protein n=1 Tax=Alternaria ethzedia TaxID=181014 RepID=UPI0020C50167|nr:uncharacterized protein J4E87_006443 [Alternaria ethzedia]KAI4622501.1 hypothetical protein J4E87_006443 [Alternaria ethzedia]